MRKMTATKAKGKKSRPKTKLGIPDLEHSKTAVLRSLGSLDSVRGYQHAIDEFVAWYCSEPRLAFNKTVVLRYRFHLEERGLAPGTINARMAAVRRLAYEAADSGLLSPELAAGIHRVKGVRKLGPHKHGDWEGQIDLEDFRACGPRVDGGPAHSGTISQLELRRRQSSAEANRSWQNHFVCAL